MEWWLEDLWEEDSGGFFVAPPLLSVSLFPCPFPLPHPEGRSVGKGGEVWKERVQG